MRASKKGCAFGKKNLESRAIDMLSPEEQTAIKGGSYPSDNFGIKFFDEDNPNCTIFYTSSSIGWINWNMILSESE